MNFVSKFDGVLPFTGNHPKAQTHVDTVHSKAPADAVIVNDADLLFNGHFKRSGTDLVITKDDRELAVSDYFKGEKHAPLASPDGAYLTGKIVDALTGHVQVAQAADGSAGAAKIIGHVTKLTGSATVIRNGVSIVLNNGDNVHQGDVVTCGSNSSLGITFIDGSVFGLGSNARMVLNEMVYDPNGSNNSALVSLVQGTISFVAGATAKHGDMKVDTPVATMGIRGTAVLVEIDFDVTVPGSAPPARFQVLVEPDGTTGSYVLLDRVTLAPIATVNQAGTVTTVSGQGTVSFLASAQLSPEALKLINEVFSQRFTDNSNPKSDTHFTDSVVPQSTFPVKFADGSQGTATVTVTIPQEKPGGPGNGPLSSKDHIPGAPEVVTFVKLLDERQDLTDSSQADNVTGHVSYADPNAGDIPTVSTAFNHFTYKNAAGQDVTAKLSTAQKDAIAAVSVPLTVVQDPAAKNFGTATWTYSVPDHALDFLAEGETLTLTYMARVDNNFALNNEFALVPFTITITGTNDKPTIVADHTNAAGGVVEDSNVNEDGNLATSGTIEFRDVDLTDTHTASFVPTSSTSNTHLPGFIDNSTYLGHFTLLPVSEHTTDGSNTGTVGWTFTVDDNDPVLQSLAEGQTITQVYTVTVSDGHGGTVTQQVTITITGANDSPNHAPVIVGELTDAVGAVTEDVGQNEANQIADNGVITFRDVDLIDTHTASFVAKSSHSDLPGFTDNTTYIGTFSLDAVSEDPTDTNNIGSVRWHFTLDDANPILQSLAEGETITQVYTVTITDNHGASVTQDVTVTITGTNDAPKIEAGSTTATGTVVEDTNVTDGNIATSGTIGFSDVDLIDAHTAKAVPISSTSNAHLPGFSDNLTYLGTFVLDPVNENTTDTNPAGSVGWHFTLDDSDPTLQSLALNQTITQVYTITISDGHGGTVNQNVTVTITGVNDAPKIEAGSTTATGTVVEDTNVSGGNIATSGTIGFSDVDLIDTHTASFVPVSSTSNAHLPGFSDNSTYIGTFALTPVSENNADTSTAGSVGWTFTLDDSNPVLQSLAEGETITQVYKVTVSDGHGGTVDQNVTVTIVGTNDAPKIDASSTTAAGTVVEDTNVSGGNIATFGTIGFSDVDLIDTHTASATLKSSSSTISLPGFTSNTSSIGTFALKPVSENNTDTNPAGSVGWTFTLDDNNAVLQSLGQGQSITQVYTVTISDGHGGTVKQDVTITIAGTNDAPSIVGETNPATHGVMVVNPVSPSIEAAGRNTPTLNLALENFNDEDQGSASNNGYGTGTFYSDDINAHFVSSGHAGIVVGSSSVTAAPFMGPLPGGVDTTKYLSIGAGATETITFDSAKNAFGLYWGSVDDYNTIKFYNGTTLIASYTGADISPLLANGNQGSFSSNGYVDFIGLPFFTKVVLGSTSNSFEIDNISAGVVPTAHAKLTGTVAGTMSVHDTDIGDTLTGLVSQNATVLYNNSSTLPNGVSVADLIKAGNITFDSVQSDGGTDILHWNYDPHGANLDFLKAGDVLKLTYTAQVSDGHTSTGSQQLVITLVGTDNTTNVSSFKFVDGTSGNDTFSNVGGGATVYGNGGSDTFVFKPASGSATIADFDPVNDTITFASSMFNHNPNDVLAATHDDGHGNTVIALNATDSITLQHVTKAQLSGSDFHFV
ncbi:MAG: hypothetical protein GY844_16300 [Bradyrhizobium sp.]|nr:hypothetical protein [Bradyrhizobium sp.]